ncbi:putative GH3 domain-containing protein [Apostichopus japonicus]|uniref:Putative GH3 domain-containing protein n=1 Tax=Stichopus japonicus TaxID=307972 RepID=A0A2G8L5D5_STIJA|nr:putative GH3 domain-containing protein [Apostichopus japonicus]
MGLITKNVRAFLFGLLLFIIEGCIIEFGFLCTNLPVRIIFGVLCLVLTATGLIFFYLASSILSSIDPLVQDLQRLMGRKILERMAKSGFAKLETSCQKYQETQDAFLTNLIAQNKDTAYGRQYEFDSIRSVEDFQSKHPVTEYIHFKPFVERVAKGEEMVLVNSRPVMIALTSGTTGESKMFLRTASRRKNFFQNFVLMFEILKRNSCSWNCLQKTATSYTHFPEKYTEGGIPLGPSSMFLKMTKQTVSSYQSPLAAFRLLDQTHSLYVHTLFALRDRNLGGMGGNFISMVLKIFETMEMKWELLVKDINGGTLNQGLDIPVDVRRDLEKELYPLPVRASELEAEFKKGFHGIAKRIWPHMEILLGVTGGSMEIYLQRLSKKYTEDILAYSSFLICTEGFLGINLWPKAKGNPKYVLCPNVLFFEFIPLSESAEEDPKVLLAESLEVGQSYLILLTNTEGLYRYRLDDVYKVVDFWHQAPVVEFEYRIGEMFNICGKKFSETVVRESILSAVGSLQCSTEFVDYACCEGLVYQEVKACHIIFNIVLLIFHNLDLEDTINAKLTELTIAEGFPDRSIGGKFHLVLVQTSSFESLLNLILSTSNAGPAQVKVPRKLRKAEWVKLLLNFEIV